MDTSDSRQKPDPMSFIFEWMSEGEYLREVSCFVADGLGVLSITTDDNPGAVDFDFFGIWEAMKAAPEMPKKVYMYHTHPPEFAEMSSMDRNMVKGWATALAMPIDFVVISGAGMRLYRCLQGNVVEDKGFLENKNPNELFIVAVMCGLSRSPRACTDDELDEVLFHVDHLTGKDGWSFRE